MGKQPPQGVVIQRRTFASSLVLGLFGTVCVAIVCATCVAIYSVKVVNERLDELIAVSPDAIKSLIQWQEALPPAVSDALNDRRMPEYRDQITIKARLVRDWKTERQIPIIEVTNHGDQIVSLLSIRLAIENEERMPMEELTVYAATPLAVENDWRGPLLPESTRRFRAGRLRTDTFADLDITWEISELRVWDGPARSDASELIPSSALTSEATEMDGELGAATDTAADDAEPAGQPSGDADI